MTSRIIFLSVLLFLFLQAIGLLGTMVFSQEHLPPYLAESTGDHVNVRAGQSANFERLCQLAKGEEVVVLGKEYSWYKIQLPSSAKSFVNKNYVQFLGLNAGGITAADVNIRAGAGIHHTVLGQLAKGVQIYIQEEFEEWYRIEPIAESYGWVSQDFLVFKSNDISGHQIVSLLPRLRVEEVVQGEVLEGELAAEDQDYLQENPFEEPEEVQPKGVISVVGTVKPYEKEGDDSIYYKIVADGEPVCYIQGVNHMLGRFVDQQVSVDGTVNQKLFSEYPHPVIVILKVRLIL